MEPVTSTLLVTLAKIAGTGVLTRAAGNAFDAVSPKIQEFFGVIQSKLPGSKTAKALETGQELDYEQTIIDAYEGLRRVGKIVAILAIMPIVPFWWGYRQLRFLWLRRRRKIRRQRRG
jgi:hypothetical protein